MPPRRREKGRKSRKACDVATEIDSEALKRENEALFEEMYDFVGTGQSESSNGEVEKEAPPETERKSARSRRRTQRQNEGGGGEVVRGGSPTRERNGTKGCPSRGELEAKRLSLKLSEMGLEIYDIKPDGNCLYNSVAQQLMINGRSTDAKATPSFLRKMTAEEMRRNSEEYIPYLDDSLGFDAYCDRVEKDQSMWGGQLEIRALCHSLRASIWVVSADAPTVKMGVEYLDEESGPLVLAFHRYLFALGYHYNGVRSSEFGSEGAVY
ncbi:OTU domain-containing protein 6A-like [Schistocerca gregaria]|uniref:OTU domain-containing protein 6A-like n=1 Tax=Schistocerca gregaria TaxID=7010 RepID=UPI00211EE4FA|nr:OTU domain-containing protein 6A-like [Schistocerca gregaria]